MKGGSNKDLAYPLIITVVLVTVSFMIFRKSKYLDKAIGVSVALCILMFGYVFSTIQTGNKISWWAFVSIITLFSYFVGLYYVRAKIAINERYKNKK